MRLIAMKFVKTVFISSVIAAALFGAQAFAHGGGGGGGGGGHGGGGGGGMSAGFSGGGGGHGGFGSPGFVGNGTSYGGAITSGSSYGGVGASAGYGQPTGSANVHESHSRDRYGYGYGYGGYGYGLGYGQSYWPGWDDASAYQLPDDSVANWNREQDRRRAKLHDSDFVKNYGTVRRSIASRPVSVH